MTVSLGLPLSRDNPGRKVASVKQNPPRGLRMSDETG